MNTKIGVAILAVACVGLAVVLVVFKNKAETQQTEAAAKILDFSNQITEATARIEDLDQRNLILSNNLATTRQTSLTVSNQLSEQLTEAAGTLAATAASNQIAQLQITNLKERISGLDESNADLEAQNQALDQRANLLSNTIAAMDAQINLTRAKLATSETNNAFLDAELKRQIAARDELQRKFNDLVVVREQARKLRDDMLIARRLEWMSEGIDPTKPLKGGQLLMMRSPPVNPAAPAAGAPLSDLNVEVGSDGTVHVIPPPTNAPAH